MNELKQGTPLQGGKYIIKRVLGQGGFGITYLAEQVSLGRDVAVKEFFMKDNCVRDTKSCNVLVPTTGSAAQVKQYRRKFQKEARMLAGFIHPNIVSVIDVFEENGTVYYSMPYYAGGSLKEMVTSTGKLTEDKAMEYVRKIALALKYMHQDKHVCHFDVKPDNILFDINGNPVLIDFGISKNYDDDGNQTSSTPVGISEGYAPIEQYQQMVEEFSPASDVYALGATLFYMITGTKPPTVISRISGEELNFGKVKSSPICELIERAMIIGVKKRPSDVDLFMNYSSRMLSDSALNEDHVHEDKYEDNVISCNEPNQKREVNPIIQKQRENMVFVKGGTFTMGCSSLFGLITGDRTPHEVTLSSFYICKYQVTIELWKAVMGDYFKNFKGEEFKGDLRRPVEQGYWEYKMDIIYDFIKKLNELTGCQFRLPTEAEWEYAALGGNKSRGYKYPGSNQIKNVAWYEKNSGGCSHPVGMKAPNELGLYDMCGNVQELCSDYWEPFNASPAINPKGPKYSYSGGNYHVIRGGDWHEPAFTCTTKVRHYDRRGFGGYHIGLRLAMDYIE